MNDLRISFAEAIAEPRLLKPRFEELSVQQQVALKVLYGCELTSKVGDSGWSELDWWSAQQGEGVYDSLGYMVEVRKQIPYTPKEYREGWIVGGRRGGKTDAFAATIVAFEAVCGGHEDHIRPGQVALCFQIAQDMRLARHSLHGIRATVESMKFVGIEKIKAITADRIDLWNHISIAVVPPTTKSVRGYANPVAVFDEVGVWYQDADSAHPDFEVYRAVSPGQAQFPYAKIVGISSPWTKSGILFDHYEAGTDGRHCKTAREKGAFKDQLVIHFTSASSGNPRLTKSWLVSELARDARAFARECLARFQDSLSGFLPTSLLQDAVDSGIRSRPPAPLNFYVAAIDPAFRNDAFAFAICHVEAPSEATPNGAVIFDVIERWKAPPGGQLDPVAIIRAITPILKDYRVISVLSDQYQFESFSKLAMDSGWAVENFRFTGASKQGIYGNLRQLVLQKRIRLLDHPETLQELSRIEQHLTVNHQVQIHAPEGEHDDMATVVALAASRATWMLPEIAPPPEEPLAESGSKRVADAWDKLIEARCHEQAAQKREARSAISPNEIWD